jgi:hypothetical protein
MHGYERRGVAAPFSYAVLGATTAMYGQRAAFVTEREKRREARRDDLRSVLDDAAAQAIAYQRPFGDAAATLGSILGRSISLA